MTSTTGDLPPPHVSIPWFGARKTARKLAAEVQELRAQLDRFTVLGHQLVAEIKEVRAERDLGRQQLEALGALSRRRGGNASPAFPAEPRKLRQGRLASEVLREVLAPPGAPSPFKGKEKGKGRTRPPQDAGRRSVGFPL